MNKRETTNNYFNRINKVIEYIANNLDEKLDLKTLAAISNFSEFHFHRIMRSYLKEYIGSYVLRLRLDTAAKLLRYSKEPIQDIAFKVGYEMPSSLNKAFKKRFNVSPGEFREAQGFFRADGAFIKQKKDIEMMKTKPKIRKLKDQQVIYIQTQGYNSEKIGPIWKKLVGFMKEKKLFGFKTEFLGISYDDPNITEMDNCRYEACATVRKEIKPEREIGFKTIQGGKFAIFKHKGPYEKFNETYDAIYQNWLPESRYKLRDMPCFEKYLTNPDKTKQEKHVTEIYIPIDEIM